MAANLVALGGVASVEGHGKGLTETEEIMKVMAKTMLADLGSYMTLLNGGSRVEQAKLLTELKSMSEKGVIRFPGNRITDEMLSSWINDGKLLAEQEAKRRAEKFRAGDAAARVPSPDHIFEWFALMESWKTELAKRKLSMHRHLNIDKLELCVDEQLATFSEKPAVTLGSMPGNSGNTLPAVRGDVVQIVLQDEVPKDAEPQGRTNETKTVRETDKAAKQQPQASRAGALWWSRKEMEDHFSTEGNDEGKQISQYFNYLNFVQINNVVMSLWCLIGWAPHARNMYSRMNAEGLPTGAVGRTGAADLLFLSTFQPSSDPYWNAMVCLATLTMFSTGPAYYFISKRYFDDEQVDADGDLETIDVDDRTSNYDEYNGKSNVVLLCRSYSIFGVICAIPTMINYALMFGLNQKGLKSSYEGFAGSYPPSVSSNSAELNNLSTSSIFVVVAIVKTVNDLVFELIAPLLTNTEKHVSFSNYRYHRLFKLVIFRLSNTMSLFLIRYFADVPFFPCHTGRIAYQVFVLIFLELTLNNIVEMLYAVIGIWLTTRKRTTRENEQLLQDDEAGLDIELTDDYFEILYRQYLMMAFITVFPLICMFNLLCNLVEWPLDKLRFVYLSKPKIKGNFQNSRMLLSRLFFFAALSGLLHFPSGPIWFAPPVGPYLCWPCNTFSQMSTANGSCQPNFEQSMCQDYSGNAIGQDFIQAKISLLISESNQSSPAAVGAHSWFQQNDHLFRSRRCGCRPCNLVISCSCHQRPVQMLGTSSNISLPRSHYSYARWLNISNTSKAAGCGQPVSPECWTCPEAFNEFVDPIQALKSWRKLYFCQRCVQSSCICDRYASGCAFSYNDAWQLVE